MEMACFYQAKDGALAETRQDSCFFGANHLDLGTARLAPTCDGASAAPRDDQQALPFNGDFCPLDLLHAARGASASSSALVLLIAASDSEGADCCFAPTLLFRMRPRPMLPKADGQAGVA